MIKQIVTNLTKLRTKSGLVLHPDLDYIKVAIKDMEDTCKALRGYGITAVQLGYNYRMCVIMNTPGTKNMTLYNPILLSGEGKIIRKESCFSLPGVSVMTERFETVKVKLHDDSIITLTGMGAIVAQHELNHMDGILITDKEVKINSNIGRNDPCPFCLEKGITIKYKKCKEHNK